MSKFQLNCRFVILSNGNLHYFWDLERGNPHIITAFPSPDSVEGYKQVEPNPQRLIDERANRRSAIRCSTGCAMGIWSTLGLLMRERR